MYKHIPLTHQNLVYELDSLFLPVSSMYLHAVKQKVASLQYLSPIMQDLYYVIQVTKKQQQQ